MRMAKGRTLQWFDEEWQDWKFNGKYLITPEGWELKPHQVVTGYYLLQIGAEPDISEVTTLMKTARALQRYLR
ncbi:DUF3653 domain-containing protein [Thaumasiovibrio subtropicus]|nr:DUF3653 domain-containing protein [Thaumasiovibrio subtropicus]